MFSCEYCTNFKNTFLKNICERLIEQGHDDVMFPVNRYHIKYLQDTKQEDFSLNQHITAYSSAIKFTCLIPGNVCVQAEGMLKLMKTLV